MIIAALHLLTNLRPSILSLPAIILIRTGIGGTVAFVSMSGFMIGYAFQRRPERTAEIVARYRGHALKLMLAHPLILLALYNIKRLTIATHGLALRSWFITDTFAAMFLIVVPLLPRLSARARVLAGVACLLIGRILYVLHLGHWTPTVLLMDVLVGTHPNGAHVLYENYSLLALTGMFLIGSRLGLGFGRAQAEGREQAIPGRYVSGGALLIALGLSLIGLWLALRHGTHTVLRATLYPDYHFPLYPIHLATMLAVIAALLQTSALPRARQVLAQLGRKSLVVYVAQYYLVQWLPFTVGLYGHMNLPEYFLFLAAAIVILNWIARLFERSWKWDIVALVATPPSPRPVPSVSVAAPPDPPSDRFSS